MNKRKLSLIFAVSLTAISAVQAAPTEFSYNVKSDRMQDQATGRFISWAKMARINADRALSMYAPEVKRVETSGFAQSYGPYQATGAGALVPSSRVTIPASFLEKALCYLNPKRAAAVALSCPLVATGVMAAGYYNESQETMPASVELPAVNSDAKSTGYLAKAQDLFNNYANKEAVGNGVNAVVEGVKTHKKAAIGAAGLAALVGVVKAFAPTSKDEQAPVVEQTPQVEQASVVEPVVEPVVEQVPVKVPAKKFVKLTVAEIAQAQGANVQGVINELKAHGYTKIDLKASDLKQAGKLNDGQIRFIVSRIR